MSFCPELVVEFVSHFVWLSIVFTCEQKPYLLWRVLLLDKFSAEVQRLSANPEWYKTLADQPLLRDAGELTNLAYVRSLASS